MVHTESITKLIIFHDYTILPLLLYLRLRLHTISDSCKIFIQMFNQLLLRPDCCSSSNVRFMSDGLGQIDAWLAGQAGDEDTAFMASLLPELRHTRQASFFTEHAATLFYILLSLYIPSSQPHMHCFDNLRH